MSVSSAVGKCADCLWLGCLGWPLAGGRIFMYWIWIVDGVAWVRDDQKQKNIKHKCVSGLVYCSSDMA